MGSAGASDHFNQAHRPQAWLATGDERAAKVSGQYFCHVAPLRLNRLADNVIRQEQLLEICLKFTEFSYAIDDYKRLVADSRTVCCCPSKPTCPLMILKRSWEVARAYGSYLLLNRHDRTVGKLPQIRRSAKTV